MRSKLNNTTTRTLKIDVLTVFASEGITIFGIVETIVCLDVDKGLGTDELDVETVVWIELDKVLETDELEVEIVSSMKLDKLLGADELDVESVVSVELVEVPEASKFNLEIAPPVFEYIQS